MFVLRINGHLDISNFLYLYTIYVLSVNAQTILFVHSFSMLHVGCHPPLRERVLKAASPTASLVFTSGRPHHYKEWSTEQLTLACKAVARGTSIRRAAEEYNIPRSTLQDRVYGRVPDGKLSGPPRYLTNDEENELVEFICMCAKIGYAKSRLEIFCVCAAGTEDERHCWKGDKWVVGRF